MPRRSVIISLLLASVSLPSWAADIGGKVTLGGAPAAHVVVYVENAKGGPSTHPNALNQVKLQFEPWILPVVKGTKVIFPNTDPIFHSVYSAKGSAPFDLGLYMKGPGKTFTFNQPGWAQVNCHIHKQMQAYLLVLDNGFFTTTDAAGQFSLKGVPGSGLKVTAWAAPDKTQTKPAAASLSFDL